jgi:hypothetical protein
MLENYDGVLRKEKFLNLYSRISEIKVPTTERSTPSIQRVQKFCRFAAPAFFSGSGKYSIIISSAFF